MKKIITIILFSLFSFSLVNADLIPNITKNQKFISGENILNVKDFPEWTFFQKTFLAGRQPFQIIPNDGNIGCDGGSISKAIEIWAIKDISKVKDTILAYEDNVRENNNSYENIMNREKTFYNTLTENGAIKLAEREDFEILGCTQIVSKDFPLEKITSYLIITKEMFYLSRDFRLNNKLSNKIKKDLETLIDSAYEKFDKKEVNKILISRIDELLSTEERERIIFALSYLKFLAIESIN